MAKENRLHYFKELKEIDESNLKLIFTEKQLNELFKNNIIKLSNSKFQFNYVGIIFAGDSICIILPKYLSDGEIENERQNDEKTKTKLLTKLLKAYFTRTEKTNEAYETYLGDKETTVKVNEFALYDFLISDYIEYGLYENHKEIYDFNGEGEIDWEKTVNECDSYLTRKKRPIYLEYFTYEIEADNSNYIKKLHKHYLNLASCYFENIHFLGFDYPRLNFSVEEEELGNLEFQIFKIYQELQVQYSERKIKLLKTLLVLLEDENHETEKSLLFYGTTVFYDVWEKSCKVALGDQYESYKKYILRPQWENQKKNTWESETLRPDILVLRDDIFYIFDAKYYNPDMENKTGFPGMDSIGKQYLYELAFLNCSDLKNKSRKNIFLVPYSGNEIEGNGKVSVEFMKKIGNVELQDIRLFRLPDKRVFDLYIENSTFSPEEFFLFKRY